ncbi:MAG: RluA family pseudouridine synthase [Clostridiaceae bacterium]|jgi:23S rRNA pseudouridine955/2504/2580 synthase|nr:RluA family pseudouridine synthase [Clostridiaceae bacterium]
MRILNYRGTPIKLSKLLQNSFPDLSYNKIQRLFREREIKLDGVRIREDVTVFDCSVEIFLPEFELKTIFEDENILVIFKPKGIKSQGVDSVETHFKDKNYAICHRLDTNTDGLLVIAKNQTAQAEILTAFKTHSVKKFYRALVNGNMTGTGELIGYLKKDAETGFAQIFSLKAPGSVQVITEYRALMSDGSRTLLELSPVTGKTHQIRAQLAAAGHFILGDMKYGNAETNKLYGARKQMLSAYKIEFNFKEGTALSYLNGKIIEAEPSDYSGGFKGWI